MKYTLKMVLESRYAEKDDVDIIHLKEKIQEWADYIKKDNNTTGRHLGLHFSISKNTVHIGVK